MKRGNRRGWLLTVAVCLSLAGQVRAQPPAATVGDASMPVQFAGGLHSDAGVWAEELAPASEEPCAIGAAERFVPNMLGDFIGGFYFGPAPPPNIDPRAVARMLPRFKVADNNSPLPRTRIEYSHNYFNDAFDTNGNVYRHFFGGEVALLDGRASLAVRASVNSFRDFDFLADTTEFGYLVTTLKGLLVASEAYAWSGGLAMGWPTSELPGILEEDNFILSPWTGAIYAPPAAFWFAHGFFQVDVPTEEMDQVVLQSDVGLGVYLFDYRPDRLVRQVLPTIEMHVYSPLGAAGGAYRGMGYDDVANMTLGTTALLGERLTLALAASFPITDQKDYDYELQFHLNWYLGPRR
jgi:hypothetical protein